MPRGVYYAVHISSYTPRFGSIFKRESTLPSLSRPLSKVVQCKGIKAINKEVDKVAKTLKSAVEYTRGGNGSANTIQAAAIVPCNHADHILAQSLIACSISARTTKSLAQLGL